MLNFIALQGMPDVRATVQFIPNTLAIHPLNAFLTKKTPKTVSYFLFLYVSKASYFDLRKAIVN